MKFYRYEVVEYAQKDYDGEYMNPTFPNPCLELREYDLIGETPKGYWVGYTMGSSFIPKKWVSKTSKKRFAYPTTEEALTNFIKRTEKRMNILDWQLQVCKISINLAKNIKL
jgi:hypothetical protein